jgi:ribosomal protein S18 acetylase RimI-like enzyme
MRILKLTSENRRQFLPQALALHRLVLGPISLRRFRERLRGLPKRLLLVALEDDRVVGFKFGYQERPGRFYSWLGGVHPDFRRRGIASQLMRRQHRLLERAGFQEVRCHTRNRFRGMLLMSIEQGFDIIGIVGDRLILSKKLGRNSKGRSERL